jgi:hypothetical protein
MQMIQRAYWLPLTFQSLSLKRVELIGPQSEPRQSSYTTNSVCMVTYCSFIMLPVGAMELTIWLLIRAMSGSLVLYNTHVGVYHQHLRLLLGDLTRPNH